MYLSSGILLLLAKVKRGKAQRLMSASDFISLAALLPQKILLTEQFYKIHNTGGFCSSYPLS
jgi:hypothetical protein